MDTTESLSGEDTGKPAETTNITYDLGEYLYRHHDVEYSTAHRLAKAASAFFEPRKLRAETAEAQLRACAIHMSEKADALAAAQARIAELSVESGELRAHLVKAEARNAELEAGLKRAAEMADALPELNMSNFDHDEVSQLNSGAVDLCLFLRGLSPLLPEYKP